MSEEKKPVMKILDASAVLAWLRDESGAKQVGPMFSEAGITSVNLIELLSKLIDFELPPDEMKRLMLSLGIEVLDVGERIAWIAAELRTQTKAFGLSLADRVCIAAAIDNRCPVVTADRAWANLDLPIEVLLIR